MPLTIPRTTTTPRRRRRRTAYSALVVAPAILLSVLLSSCAGTPSTDDGANEGADSTKTGTSTATTRDEYDLELAKCLRDAGFDVKDPAPGQGITETADGLNEGASKCMATLGNPPVAPPLTAAQLSELHETELKAAACIRGHGFDFPDPTADKPFFLPAEIPSENVEDCMALFSNQPGF